MKKITLFIALIIAISVSAQRTSKNYLIQVGGGSGATWTKTLNENDSIVDLSIEGKTLTEWLTSRTSWIRVDTLNLIYETDNVWIAAGNYAVASNYTIPGTSTQYPRSIYGGFAGTENSIEDRAKGINPWDYTNETIINGSASTGTLPGIINAGGARVISFDGITFTECSKDQAVYLRPRMTIQNCKFTSNTCTAINYYTNSAAVSANVIDCYFYNNIYTNISSSNSGAGCININNASIGGTVRIIGCVFESNSTTVALQGSSACVKAFNNGITSIENCKFINNSADHGGASAVSLGSLNSSITNSLIIGSTGSKYPLYITNGSVINCSVVGNPGGGAFLSNSTNANAIKIINSVFWGTEYKAGFISGNPGILGLISNSAYIGVTPNFAGVSTDNIDLTVTSEGIFSDPVNNDWQLAAESLLIDLGTPTGAPTTDIRGFLRTGSIDIGAYEFGAVSSVRNTPKNKQNIVSFHNNKLISNKDGVVQVYSVVGRMLINQKVNAGDIIDLSSGVYIIKLNSTSDKLTQKVVF